MVQKHLICPQRIRKIPKQFSWLDHRLVRDHYIDRCSHSPTKNPSIRYWPWIHRLRQQTDIPGSSNLSLKSSNRSGRAHHDRL